jgi:hypothetical protein
MVHTDTGVAVSGVLAFLAFFLGGVLLGGAVLCGAGALTCLVGVLTTRYACPSCRKNAAELSAEEQGTLFTRRLAFGVGAVVCTAAAIGLVVLWRHLIQTLRP